MTRRAGCSEKGIRLIAGSSGLFVEALVSLAIFQRKIRMGSADEF